MDNTSDIPRPSLADGTISTSSWLLLGLLSLLWGGSFLFNEAALRDTSPLIIITSRSAIASVALLVITRAAGYRMPRSLSLWASFFVMGALNNLIPMLLIANAQTRITGGFASILMATTPLCTALTARMFTNDSRERLSGRGWIGIGLGFIGVVVLMGPSALIGARFDLLAETAVLCASVSYGFANIFGRRFADSPPIVSAAGQLTGTAVMAVPLTLAAQGIPDLSSFSITTWVALFGLALLSTACAYVLFFWILARTGAIASSLVTLMIPVTAIILGNVWFGDPIVLAHLFGMLLIGIGLVTLDTRLSRLFAVIAPTHRQRKLKHAEKA